MRIVAGKLRGRIINAPSGDSTRPTSDKTRESIFNIIGYNIIDANVLDIFSGSGALAIEAYSRGAKKITLIDSSVDAIKTINSNIELLKIENSIVIFDSYKCIEKLNDKFNVVLLDPPYAMDVFDEVFEMLIQNDLLSNNAIIVYESNDKHVLKDNYSNFALKVYKYGIAYVNVLKRK